MRRTKAHHTALFDRSIESNMVCCREEIKRLRAPRLAKGRQASPAISDETTGPGRPDTRHQLLQAAATCLRQDGYAGFSTRRVADLAGVPLSQIAYHFGSRSGLVLALLAEENARLLRRQAATFSEAVPLSERWQRACDYLDEDLASGYVRVLQEMMAAGWSDPEIAAAMRQNLRGWYDLLTRLAEEAGHRFGGLGPFSPEEVASLVGSAFLGSEAMILLGLEGTHIPARQALRKVGVLIRAMEMQVAQRQSGWL